MNTILLQRGGPVLLLLRRNVNRPFSSFSDSIHQLSESALSGHFQSKDWIVPFPRNTVSLLHPPGSCSAFTRSGSQYPPLGLLQLKALIGDNKRVDVLEADAAGLTPEDTIERLKEDAPLAVGMTVTCGTKKLVGAWSAVLKNLSEHYQPIVIVGGPAAAYETPSILQDCPHVDVVVKGEGEVTFPKMIPILEEMGSNRTKALKRLSQISGVVVRGMPMDNDSSIPNVPAEAFETLPFPDLSGSPVEKYQAPDALCLPMVTMMTQRGCIAQCDFCNTPQIHGRTIRGWSNEQVIQELKKLKAMHGLKQVSFVDDVFTNRPGGGPRKLCELMIQEQLDLKWYCNARADQVTLKMARAMKDAGCHQVFLGFESGCDKMLKRINKGETVADLERGAGILKQVGISISIGFIVGLPGETDASVQASIDLCNRVQPNRVQFTRFTPIPGSVLAAQVGHDPESSFHDRSRDDPVEGWLRRCYAECQYKPSV
eukprot:Nitzschia sp. Nitz4//scaffold217_size45653//37824//39278//NITZ4_007229-RA/size45653-processed-gene-0.28-mRNA-1//-1//CDS//3329542252//8296//frame0